MRWRGVNFKDKKHLAWTDARLPKRRIAALSRGMSVPSARLKTLEADFIYQV